MKMRQVVLRRDTGTGRTRRAAGTRNNPASAWLSTLVVGVVAIALFLAARRREEVKRFVRESRDHARHLVRQSRRRAERRRRYEQGRWKGIHYRIGRRFPNPDVDEDLLADRVRSMLGPVEKRFDIPRIHVTAEDHRVILHGDVDNQETADALVRATREISGVHEVASHLAVGLTRGETRPSQGRAVVEVSEAYSELISAAGNTGLDGAEAPAAAGAVLLSLLTRLPSGTRRHFASHLPHDVVALLPPLDWDASPPARLRRPEQFAEEVASLASLQPTQAEPLIGAVFATLRRLVPEEVDPIAKTLPVALREMWRTAA